MIQKEELQQRLSELEKDFRQAEANLNYMGGRRDECARWLQLIDVPTVEVSTLDTSNEP